MSDPTLAERLLDEIRLGVATQFDESRIQQDDVIEEHAIALSVEEQLRHSGLLDEINRLTQERDAALSQPTLRHDVTKIVLAITTDDLIIRLRQHVRARGKPSVPNGAWSLMLEASNQLTKIVRARDAVARRAETAEHEAEGRMAAYLQASRHLAEAQSRAQALEAEVAAISRWRPEILSHVRTLERQAGAVSTPPTADHTVRYPNAKTAEASAYFSLPKYKQSAADHTERARENLWRDRFHEKASQIFGEWALRHTGTAATKAEKMVELITTALIEESAAAERAGAEKMRERAAQVSWLAAPIIRALPLPGEE